jgi:hypothetical protein
MKRYYLLALFMGLACFAAAAGCTEQPATDLQTPTAEPTVTPASGDPPGPQPSFETATTTPVQHFRADGSCYFRVTGSVTNTGSAPGKNVVVRFLLIDEQSNAVRSTETMLLPQFAVGETKQFTVAALNGDCGRSYRAEIRTMHDIS